MKIEYFPKLPGKKEFQLKLPVIYEDHYLAIVYKPAGLSTSANQFKTLENALPANLSLSSQPGAYTFPKPVHRLDRPTSGLVLIAKTPKVRVQLGRMLEEKDIEKRYLAVVRGNIESQNGLIKSEIENKPAHSTFRVVKKSHDSQYSLLELSPITGRTHQLRIHCAQNGWPILGDNQYGDGKGPGKGLFLCAYALSFRHPVTN